MDASLKFRCRRIDSVPLSYFHYAIDALLLGTKNNNRDDEESVNGEHHDARRSSESRPESGWKDGSAFPAVEINSQGSRQHDPEKWNDPDENAEHARLERGTNGDSPVHGSGFGSGIRAQAGEWIGLRDLRRNLVRRGIQAWGNSGIRNHNLHVDLGSAALRAERPAILDRGPTLLARVLHVFETSAQRTGRARRRASGDLEIGSSGHRVIGNKKENKDHPMSSDRIFLAGVHAHIHEGKVGSMAAGFDRDDMLVFFSSNL